MSSMDQFRRRCEGGKKHFAIALAKAAKERRAAQFAKIAEGKKTELDSNRYAHKLSGGGGRKSAAGMRPDGAPGENRTPTKNK